MMENEAIQWNNQMVYAMTWSVLCLTLGGSSLFYILIQRGVEPRDELMYWFHLPPLCWLWCCLVKRLDDGGHPAWNCGDCLRR
jgi:hypothetical protein